MYKCGTETVSLLDRHLVTISPNLSYPTDADRVEGFAGGRTVAFTVHY